MNDNPTFVCVDCAINVFVVGGDWDGRPICGICRFIRGVPDMPEHLKRELRGEDNEEDLINPA